MQNKIKPHTKYYADFNSLKVANGIMGEFQILRNIVRTDYLELLFIAKDVHKKPKKFVALYRACLVQLFTVIEADMYGFNSLDPFDASKTKKNFRNIFLNTFKQIGKTWTKNEIVEVYISNYFNELMLIKEERNDLTHPKKITKIISPSIVDLIRLETAFLNYVDFIKNLTNGFFIAAIPQLTFEQIMELKEQSEAFGLTLRSFTIDDVNIL